MHHYCEFVSTKCWRLWTYNTIMHVTSNFWITWQQILSLPGHGGDTLLIKLLLLRLWVRGSCPIWWISIILCEWEHQPWWLCWWFPWKWRWWGLSWWLQDHDGDNDTVITIDPSKDVRYSKLNEGEKLKYDCVICLELQIGKASSDKWVAILPCHHTFHEECILQHIMFKNNKCCLCRMQFNCDHDQNKNDN